jgi:hypothetical protein
MSGWSSLLRLPRDPSSLLQAASLVALLAPHQTRFGVSGMFTPPLDNRADDFLIKELRQRKMPDAPEEDGDKCGTMYHYTTRRYWRR